MSRPSTRVPGLRGPVPLRGPASLRGRVVLGVVALLTVVLALLFTGVDTALSARLHADVRTRLTDRVGLARQLDGSLSAQQLVDRLRGDGVTAQLCAAGAGSGSGPGSASGGSSGSADGSLDGCVVGDAVPVPPAGPTAGPGRRGGPGARGPAAPTTADVTTAGPVLIASADLAGGQRLTLTTDTTQIAEALRRLVLFEVVGGLLALAVTGAVLSRVSRVALRPLDTMTGLARDIAGGDRGRRLDSGRSDTELGRTALAFDAMLDGLEDSARSARAAESRMREFLGDASHELRTPLAGLQANAELLLRDDPPREDRETRLLAMIRETRRAGRMVEDLLTSARLDRGLDLRHQRVDVAALLAGELARARLLAPDRRIELVGDTASTAAVVSGDPVRLGQVLTNLLDNARHATAPGGRVTASVSRSNGTGAPEVVVTVADDGVGVPPSDRERIFARFTRGDPSRSRHTGGAGLGLPIARGLARAHGGDLRLLDGPGGGARFELRLPAALKEG